MEWETVTGPNQNLDRFLNVIKKAEAGEPDLIVGKGGRFSDFTKHPRVVGLTTKQGPSTAAGNYMITAQTYDDVAPKIGVKGFTEADQRAIAVELIRRNGALDDVMQGNFEPAIKKLGKTWASLPSSPYDQPKRDWNFVNAQLYGGANNTVKKNDDEGWETVVPAQGASQTASNDGWETVVPALGQRSSTPVVTPGATNAAPAALSQVASNVSPTASQAVPKKPLTDEQLNSDPTWVSNARRLYKETSGKDFQGADVDAANWLKNYVAQTNHSIGGAATTAYDATQKLSDEGKQALLDSIKVYSAGPTSMESVGRFLKAQLTDPANYVTGGVGAAAVKILGKKALQEGTELAIKNALEKNLVKKLTQSTGTKAVATGAASGVVGNAADQGVQIAANGQEGYDAYQAVKAAGIGAVAGKTLDSIVNKITGRSNLNNFVKEAGSAENARVKAEVTKDFKSIADNPNLRAVNDQGQTTVAAIMRNEQSKTYFTDVEKALKRVDPALLKKYDVERVLGKLRTVAPGDTAETVGPATLSLIRNEKNGDVLADAIEKYQKSLALTAPTPASGSLGAKAVRMGIEYAPKAVTAAAGTSTFGPAGLAAALITPKTPSGWAQRLTGKKTIPEVIEQLSSPNNITSANSVLRVLGNSKAFKGAEDMGTLARSVEQATTAKKAAQQLEISTAKASRKEAADAAEQLRVRNLQLGIRSTPGFQPEGLKITGGPRATLQYYGRLADSKELAKGLKIIENTDPYLTPYIKQLQNNKNVPNEGILLHLSDRLLMLREQGILKPYIKP